MAKFLKFLIFILYFAFFSVTYSQIRIIEQSFDKTQCPESSDWQNSPTRKIVSLNSNWTIYVPNYPEDKSRTSVPSTFIGASSLIYQRDFEITAEELDKYKISLDFKGLNYGVEISLNNLVIFKQQVGEIPFEIELPTDIIKTGSPNRLSLTIIHDLDDQNTIPMKQRFLFPANNGGIIGDINLVFVPKLNISKANVEYSLSDKLDKVEIKANICIDDQSSIADTLLSNNPREAFQVKIDLHVDDQVQSTLFELDQNFRNTKDSSSIFTIDVTNPALWSPSSPNVYKADIQLLFDDQIIDQTSTSFTVYSFVKTENGFKLNNENFVISGVSYIPSEPEYGNLISCEKLRDDLTFIKETGFNTVRFAKEIPSVDALKICQEVGLFSFIEIPINSVTDELAEQNEFTIRAKDFLKNFCNYYGKISGVIAVGVGSSYLPNSTIQLQLATELAEVVKEETDKLSYASFITVPVSPVENLDLYGIELYSKLIDDYSDKFESAISQLGQSSLFISDAVYPTFNGGTNGHLTPNSFESQAKYYSDLFGEITEQKINGYFLGPIMDYSGDYTSFYAGYDENSEYAVGIVDKDKNENRLAYKVINSKLLKKNRVTIPIGNKKDDAPIFFILTSLFLSVVMALLINSKRKFREDSTRALLRPYNFFADIRDHRIMSGFHTIVLMLVLGAANSLLFTNLLYFFRSNMLFEKLLLSFGSVTLTKTIGYLAWHPVQSFFYLYILSIVAMFVITLLIKLASFFRKNKVYYSSIFYAHVWALLPLTLLLPVELILYKVLTADAINWALYLIIGVYLLWLLQRVLKGIYVIFDSRPGLTYFYGLLLIALVVGGTILYYQLTESTIWHIFNAIEQYKLI